MIGRAFPGACTEETGPPGGYRPLRLRQISITIHLQCLSRDGLWDTLITVQRQITSVIRHRFLTAILAFFVLVAPGFAKGGTKAPQGTVRRAKKIKPYKGQKIKPYKGKKINRKSNRIR
jgi:hypothetical protein